MICYFCRKVGEYMSAPKLLIADSNDDFRLALAEALQEHYHVHCCQNGKNALELLHTYRPDVLVLDLMLPELDGISLLQAAADSGIRPKVLATSRFVNDYVLEMTKHLGVNYLMMKPCDVQSTVNRIQDLNRHPCHSPAASDPKVYASNLLLSLGIPTKLRGYEYLRQAVVLMAQDPEQSITKELYPAVGQLCHCKAGHVERSIRNAIDAAWHRRDDRVWMQYFSPGPDGTIPRPTNAALISRLADNLLLNQEGTLV